MYKFLSVLLVVLFVSCAEKKDTKAFTTGEMKGRVYTNTYFGLSMEIPGGFYLVDESGLELMENETIHELKANDPGKNKEYDAASNKYGFLVIVHAYPADSVIAVNPKIALSYLNIASTPRLKDPEKAIRLGFDEMKKMQYPIEYDGIVTDKKISGGNFKFAHFQLQADTVLVQSELYDGNFDDYNLSISLTYETEEQKKKLYSLLDRIKFK